MPYLDHYFIYINESTKLLLVHAHIFLLPFHLLLTVHQEQSAATVGEEEIFRRRASLPVSPQFGP